MPTKANKKTTTKRNVTKRTTRATARPVSPVMAQPTGGMEQPTHECTCQNCCCTCCCGSKFGRFLRGLIIVLLLLAVGFVAGRMYSKYHHHTIRFDNAGCLIEESIKQPRMRAVLPVMDMDRNGCITRDEYRFVKRQMRREIREMNIDIDD